MHRHDDLRQPPLPFGDLQLRRQRIDAHIPGAQIDVDEVDLGAAIEPA